MVPYEIQLPDFAEGVAPGNLGNQLAPLWLCYWYADYFTCIRVQCACNLVSKLMGIPLANWKTFH